MPSKADIELELAKGAANLASRAESHHPTSGIPWAIQCQNRRTNTLFHGAT